MILEIRMLMVILLQVFFILSCLLDMNMMEKFRQIWNWQELWLN